MPAGEPRAGARFFRRRIVGGRRCGLDILVDA